MDITRAVTPEDFVAFRALLDEMAVWDAGETSALGFDTTELLAVCYSDDARQLRQAYTAPRAAMYLARQTGEVVGCAGYMDLGEGIAEVSKVYLRPTHRGLGIGRAMIARITEEIAKEGYRQAWLETANFMKQAITSYERFGFQRCPPFRTAMGGLGPITVFMQRDF